MSSGYQQTILKLMEDNALPGEIVNYNFVRESLL